MKFFLLSFIFLSSVFACQRKTTAAALGDSNNVGKGDSNGSGKSDNATTKSLSIPTCIQHKIDSVKLVPVWNPPASIEEYDYNGKKVYVLSANCCDFFATAFDEDCNYVCAPSGGFTGKGDGLCRDFNEKAKLVRVVWKDERK